MDKKVLIQGKVTEVSIKEKTGRMLDFYNVKVMTPDGNEVTVEYEASELEKRLLPDTKIVILAYCEDDRIIGKTLNY